jgi:hypothetical protein
MLARSGRGKRAHAPSSSGTNRSEEDPPCGGHGVGERLVEEHGLAERCAPREVLGVEGRIVDLDHDGVAVRDRLVEALGDADSPLPELFLPLIEARAVLERGLEAQARHRAQAGDPLPGRTIRRLHPARELDGVARVEPDQRHLEGVRHVGPPRGRA